MQVPLVILLLLPSFLAAAPLADIRLDPPRLNLVGPGARHTVLVHGVQADGRVIDLTSTAVLSASGPRVRIAGNAISAAADGDEVVRVAVAGVERVIPVRVSGTGRPRELHFENDIEPLFGRFGCNASGCHGKAEGQNGFKLSVFGFDPEGDYAALVKEGRGRRLFAAAPERSLLLTKASGQVAHGGGTRIPVATDAYDTLAGWVAGGAPYGRADAPRVTRIRVEPAERLLAMRGSQQLRVIARYSDGSDRDVTHSARFQSNNDAVATVNGVGLVRAEDAPGEAAVMASFLNETAVFRAMVPRSEAVEGAADTSQHSVDLLVGAKLRKLNIRPSGLASDAEFLRRVSLDITGTLPTSADVRKFLADTRADKRARLIDTLLNRPEYADLWALKWSDVLRVDRQVLGPHHAYAYYRWIRTSVADNKPFDRFVRELITAEGPIEEAPAGAFFKAVPKPGEAANTLSQVFLGVRVACAECHHHPYDRWGQADYAALSAYFSPLSVRRIGNVEALISQGEPTARHPRTGETVAAAPLGGPARLAKGDQREGLATWMTDPANPFFARNLANRLWAHFLGRGLVEPVDDVRSTNPPSNPELLDALAAEVVRTRFDVKAVIRFICTSNAYQRSSAPNATNRKDEQNYSRAVFRRPDAEVFVDMIVQCSEVAERYQGFPVGTRAVQLWDNTLKHEVLKKFGRPPRTSGCTCERQGEPTISHVLHLLNGETISERLLRDDAIVARLCREQADDAKVVEEMALTILGRFPTAAEAKAAVDHVRKEPNRRRQQLEDVAWALLNTKEFMFNH